MKFNFFEKAKVGVAAAVIAGSGIQEAAAVTIPTKDSNTNKTEINVENNKSEDKAFLFDNQEINENSKKLFNLEITKEALLNTSSDVFLSNKMPGYVMIIENYETKNIDSYLNQSILLKAYKVPTGDEAMNGYYIFNININTEGDNALNELEKNGIDSDIKVNARLNHTNLLDISYIFNRISEKLGPVPAQSILEQVNPNINKKAIITSLVENLNHGNGSKDEMLESIKTLNQNSELIEGENLAENIK